MSSAVVAAVAAAPTGDFNEARLQSGQSLYAEKRYLEAIDQFRVAAFGYLNQPGPLSNTLARLALAQTGAGRPADADATIQRFLEVQRRFPAYPPPGLDGAAQADFRALLLRRVPEATLLGFPSLAGLVETEEQKIARLPPAERRRALEAASRREPNSVVWPLALARDAVDRSDGKDAEKWAAKALSLDPSNPDGLALRARARVLRGQTAPAKADVAAIPPAALEKRPELYGDVLVVLVESGDWAGADDASRHLPESVANRPDVARARQKLSSERPQRVAQAPRTTPPPAPPAQPQSPAARRPNPTPAPAPAAVAHPNSREVLAESRRLVAAGKAVEAQRALAEALKADPGNRDLRLALLEAACLSGSFREGATQVAIVAPFADAEAPSMFYAAVVLYETGKTDEARGYMQRAMPKVSGVLVDEYSKKILGQ